ncbi:MAG: thioredoxin family protein [Bacteroidia bacterium]|nr:thioredoxin family protein [Bacteroidia bacterium]
MDNKKRSKLSLGKRLKDQLKLQRKRTWFLFAGLILISSGGYYEANRERNANLNFAELAYEEFIDELDGNYKKGLIFFHTDYCYPCQRINEVFMGDVAAIELVQSNFLPYKLDAFEKEPGMMLAEKYKVDKYPTFLIIDDDGTEIGRSSFEGDKEKFLAEIRSFVGEKGKAKKSELQYKKKETRYALALSSYEKYTEARNNAMLKREIWDKEIWIEDTDGQSYELLLGKFDNKNDARLAKKYLNSWEGIDSEIRPLKAHAQSYQ